jgi:hypothetical protein
MTAQGQKKFRIRSNQFYSRNGRTSKQLSSETSLFRTGHTELFPLFHSFVLASVRNSYPFDDFNAKPQRRQENIYFAPLRSLR